MNTKKTLAKILLIFSLLIFIFIEIISLFLTNFINHTTALYVQLFAISVTTFLIYDKIKFLHDTEAYESNGWTKLRTVFTYFLGISILMTFYFIATHDYSIQSETVKPFQQFDNRIGGLFLGLMYGRNWKFHLLNGFVWAQGLGSIDWAIISVSNYLRTAPPL
jgi:hypothetical protein